MLGRVTNELHGGKQEAAFSTLSPEGCEGSSSSPASSSQTETSCSYFAEKRCLLEDVETIHHEKRCFVTFALHPLC